jgi:hypothetical protein
VRWGTSGRWLSGKEGRGVVGNKWEVAPIVSGKEGCGGEQGGGGSDSKSGGLMQGRGLIYW